jgi:hypothetical protein
MARSTLYSGKIKRVKATGAYKAMCKKFRLEQALISLKTRITKTDEHLVNTAKRFRKWDKVTQDDIKTYRKDMAKRLKYLENLYE